MSQRKLSPAAIRHGELQIKKMLKDRPAMARYITKNDFIWKWTVRKFAGEDLSDAIDWNGKIPYHYSGCDHVYPGKFERGYIRIKNAKDSTFDGLWAMAIFELHNIAMHGSFKRLIKKAHKRQLSKKQFILKMAQIEFRAVLKTRRFYKKIWEPWSRQKGLSTCPYEWYLNVPYNFKAWIRGFGKDSDYPWKIYSDFYDDHLEDWALA